MHHHGSLLSYILILIKFICVLNYRILGFPKMIVLPVDSQPWHSVTNGAIVIHTQRLKSDPGGNLLS